MGLIIVFYGTRYTDEFCLLHFSGHDFFWKANFLETDDSKTIGRDEMRYI